jgi:hypothetical protein
MHIHQSDDRIDELEIDDQHDEEAQAFVSSYLRRPDLDLLALMNLVPTTRPLIQGD